MAHDMERRVVLVTGGSGGIGRGVARQLAGRGAAVVINGRDESRGEEAVAEVRATGADGLFVRGDVRSEAEMNAAVEEAVTRFGRLDALVVNAGGDDDEARSPAVRAPFADVDLARATAFVATALTSKLVVVQAALPHLRANDEGGSVVFVTSEGGRVPTPGQTAIAGFSGGLLMISKVLAKELARDRVRVNCLCVTLVRDSPSWNAVFGPDSQVSERHRAQYERIVERSPLGVADPDDIGSVAAFLASDDSRHLTGATLSPTGGLTIQ